MSCGVKLHVALLSLAKNAAAMRLPLLSIPFLRTLPAIFLLIQELFVTPPSEMKSTVSQL
jgi:hypothetical protein